MTTNKKSLLVVILKWVTMFLLSSVLGFISLIYWDMKQDIKDNDIQYGKNITEIRVHLSKIDSTLLSRYYQDRLSHTSDSIQTVVLSDNIKKFNKFIEESGL